MLNMAGPAEGLEMDPSKFMEIQAAAGGQPMSAMPYHGIPRSGYPSHNSQMDTMGYPGQTPRHSFGYPFPMPNSMTPHSSYNPPSHPPFINSYPSSCPTSVTNSVRDGKYTHIAYFVRIYDRFSMCWQFAPTRRYHYIEVGYAPTVGSTGWYLCTQTKLPTQPSTERTYATRKYNINWSPFEYYCDFHPTSVRKQTIDWFWSIITKTVIQLIRQNVTVWDSLNIYPF